MTQEKLDQMVWHDNNIDDIYDAVRDWGMYRFVCLMTDNTIQVFYGHMDEDDEGHYNLYVDCENDKYGTDGIVCWCEVLDVD